MDTAGAGLDEERIGLCRRRRRSQGRTALRRVIVPRSKAMIDELLSIKRFGSWLNAILYVSTVTLLCSNMYGKNKTFLQIPTFLEMARNKSIIFFQTLVLPLLNTSESFEIFNVRTRGLIRRPDFQQSKTSRFSGFLYIFRL